MPVAVSYPGVYVQSIVQPTAPASGVATSLAAFLGRMAMGPVNTPVVLNQWGDHQRVFGGLSQDSSASYQVNAFFNNGGGQALGIRLFEPVLAGSPGPEGRYTEAVAALVSAARDAVGKLYPPGSTAAPKKSDVISQVSAAIAPKTEEPETQVAAKVVGDAWKSRSGALADPPAKAHAEGILDGIDGHLGTFTATISLDPLFPIVSAVNALMQALQLEAADQKATIEKVGLIAQQTANGYTGQPSALALGYLQRQAVKAPTASDALPAAAVAIPTAYQAAVPALSLPHSDPVYGEVATANGNAETVLAVLSPTANPPAVGRVSTAQAAFAAAARPDATVADVHKAIDDLADGAFKGDTGAEDVQAKVKDASVTTLGAARSAALAALTEAFGTNAQGEAAAAAVQDNTDASYGGLVALIARAVMATVTWPAGAHLELRAKSPGSWGNRLSASIDRDGISDVVATSLGFASADALFNVTVLYEDPSGATRTERFSNVTMDPSFPGLYLPSVLEHRSNFVSFAEGTVALAGSAGQGVGGNDSLPISMTTYLGDQSRKSGIYALEQVPIFNMLCIPPDDFVTDTPSLVYQTAAQYCVTRNAMLIVDPPAAWQDAFVAGDITRIHLSDLGSFGAEEGRSAAVYFPRVLAADPLRNGQIRTLPNSGYVAGLWAQTDAQTGLWKAPAGLTAALNGIAGLAAELSDTQNGVLNPIGINCLRTFPLAGSVVWGARTMRGADQLGDQYNYVPVRRMLLYLMDWALQNTKWAVFQPNNEALWSSLRVQFSNLMNGLWKQGAFFGTSADQAYFVKCDASTTLQTDIDAGRVNLQIGFAPVKPAEFVVVTLQQKTAVSS